MALVKELKDGIRSLVRIDFQGHVHKVFRGTAAEERCANEIRILQALEERECPNVPRLLEHHLDELTIVTSNCGRTAPALSKRKAPELQLNLPTLRNYLSRRLAIARADTQPKIRIK